MSLHDARNVGAGVSGGMPIGRTIEPGPAPPERRSLLRALLPYVGARAKAPAQSERCEICSVDIDAIHRHLVDLRARTICCSCQPCAILFDTSGAGTYRTVPDRVLHDPTLALQADALADAGMPVRLAFAFFHSHLQRWVCIYPGPAGTTEAELDPQRWSALQARSPLFDAATPDVEALLFRGDRGRSEVEVFLVGIDRCYELTADLRSTWQGFDGGDAARRALDAFFGALRGRSRALPARRETAR